MMERCKGVELDRYLDDELGRSGKARMEEHLAGCEDCRELVRVMKLQAELLREEVEAASEGADFTGFEQQVLDRIRADKPPPLRERAAVWIREVAYHYRAVWITSLVTAGLLLAVLVPLLSTGQGPATAESTKPEPKIAKADQVDNEVIIDSMEYAGQRSMIFTVSKNNTTVIWLYDFDRAAKDKPEGDDL